MEMKQARNWYTWLWVAPFITLPILFWLYSIGVVDWLGALICSVITPCDRFWGYTLPLVLITLSPGLLYGIILIGSYRKEDDFVRWHGLQAFALGMIYTAIPAGFVLFFENLTGLYYSLPFLAIAWFIGTRWGQGQVKRGQCSLASWLGYLEIRSPALIGAPPTVQPTAPRAPMVEPPTDSGWAQASQKLQQMVEDIVQPKPPPTVAPTPKTKKTTKKSLWGIISFAIYVIIFIASRVLGDTSNTGNQGATQTAQRQVDVQATQMVVYTAEAYQAELSTYAAWPALIIDDFRDNQNGWASGEFETEYGNGDLAIEDDRYIWDLKANTPSITSSWMDSTLDLTDFYLSVEIEVLDDPSSVEHGVYFRLQGDEFYTFLFNEEGWFDIFMVRNENWTPLISRVFSDAIRGGESNHIAIAAQGEHFVFFINDSFVAETTNADIESGDVGLIIGFDQEGEEALIAFDNFEVRTPDTE